MNEATREATFYFSDAHIGADPETNQLVRDSFDALPAFLNELRVRITKAIDLGDTVEEWDEKGNFVKRYRERATIQLARRVYSNIFQSSAVPDITACIGNHQINFNHSNRTAIAASKDYWLAAHAYRSFLKRKVISEYYDAKIQAFSGISEVENAVFGHHGDLLDSKTFLKTIENLDTNLPLEQKLRLIRKNRQVYKEVYDYWKWYLDISRPTINHLIIKTFTRPYFWLKKAKGLINETNGKTRRSISKCWYNPRTHEVQIQNNILNKLASFPEHSAIIHGHTHIPAIVQDGPGTVISLGSWRKDESDDNPVAAIRTDFERKKIFFHIEYNPLLKKWEIREEVIL